MGLPDNYIPQGLVVFYYNEYSLLDRPDILQFTFYPRKEARRGPPNSTDYFIPVSEAKELFENAATKRKRLIIINGANHNDIMMVGKERYLTVIEQFIIKSETE